MNVQYAIDSIVITNVPTLKARINAAVQKVIG